MASHKKRDIVRPCGPYEHGFAYCHYRGWYRGVGSQGRFSPAPTNERLLGAVARIALEQPMLRYGIAGEAELRSCFVRIHELALDRIVSFDHVQAGSIKEYDDKVLKAMHKSQDGLFDDMENVAPWRVAVHRPAGALEADEANSDFCDVVFTYHHAIGDGMGGAIFMEILRDILNEPEPRADVPAIPSDHKIPLPEPPQVIPEILSLIPFRTTLGWLLKSLWNLKAPSFLHLGPRPKRAWSITYPDANRTAISQSRLLRLPAHVGEELAAACRERGVSMAPLLSALLMAAAARRAPPGSDEGSWKWKDDEVYRTLVTVNLRPWVDQKLCPENVEAKRLIACLVIGYRIETGPSELEALRNARPAASSPGDGKTTPTLDSLIWSAAQAAASAQRAKQASAIVNNDISLLPHSGDVRALDQRRMLPGTPRKLTAEVGSLGLVDPYGAAGRDGAKYPLRRLIFANPAMPMSAPLMLNVAGVKGEEMTMLMTFGQGEVEAWYVEAVLADMEEWMRGWKERGFFGE